MWTLLHFPFHVALLLTMEGNSQFIVWNAVINNLDFVNDHLQPYVDGVYSNHIMTYNSSVEYAASLSQTLSEINYRFTNNLTDFSVNLSVIQNTNINTEEGRSQILEVMDELVIRVCSFVLENFGIVDYTAPAEPGPTNALSTYDFTAVLSAFSTVLLSFFIGAGSFLILLGIMYWFGKERITGSELYSVGVRVVSGTALVLSMLVYLDQNAFYNLLQSSWVLPIVVLTFAAGKISFICTFTVDGRLY